MEQALGSWGWNEKGVYIVCMDVAAVFRQLKANSMALFCVWCFIIYTYDKHRGEAEYSDAVRKEFTCH